MKNYLLTILTSIAITQGIYSQTEDGKPRERTDLISVPNDTKIVRVSSAGDTTKFPYKNYKFNMTFLLYINGQDSTGLITITKNGKPFKTINSDGMVYSMALDLNSKYLFKCTKPGYVTKTVFFNTKVPIGNEKDEFALFKCTVDLYKEDGKTQPYEKPVGEIKYNKKLKDFDYFKNYK